MNPVSPLPVNTNAQGVGSVAPIPAPTPTAAPQAPTPSPAPAATPPQTLSPDVMSTIANYYKIPRDTAQIVNAGQTAANSAQQQFEKQKYDNSIKAQNQQDALNPSKYTFQKNSDGSVTILNSAGDKVDIGTYASLTGDNPADVLQKEGATDKQSVKFVEAYNNLQDYIQNKIAAQNGDQTAQAKVQQYVAANQGLQNIQLGQLQSAFMQQYGQYFGMPQGNQRALAQNRVSDTIQSQNSPGNGTLSGLLSQLSPQGQ